ncbi:putative B3 domain-containing protein At1g78640 [Argentina anserina]|uniref:putative B3 domain-containing protein At1g78640 n=1 Tax=Argentina anserina TaxID=57926 RepID=UPI0021769507|nr:putative B3 domain-containing protein At1g78640 [Potentilla anserina]
MEVMRYETATVTPSSSVFFDSTDDTAREIGAAEELDYNDDDASSRLRQNFAAIMRLRGAWYKKTLKVNDVSESRSAVAVSRRWVVEQVLPFLEEGAAARVVRGWSERVVVHDCELDSLHVLYLRKLKTGKYVFAGRWRDEFVIRRNLKKGDSIRLCWHKKKSMFSFTAFCRT